MWYRVHAHTCKRVLSTCRSCSSNLWGSTASTQHEHNVGQTVSIDSGFFVSAASAWCVISKYTASRWLAAWDVGRHSQERAQRHSSCYWCRCITHFFIAAFSEIATNRIVLPWAGGRVRTVSDLLVDVSFGWWTCRSAGERSVVSLFSLLTVAS